MSKVFVIMFWTESGTEFHNVRANSVKEAKRYLKKKYHVFMKDMEWVGGTDERAEND